MYPIKSWKTASLGFRYGDWTFYNTKHLGVDHIVSYIDLYAPFNGTIIWEGTGTQGGKTIHFRPDGQDIVIRFMHLSEFKVGQVHVNEGDVIAVTGNTGSATTGPHLHTDISKGSVQINNFDNFIDPEEFNWGQEEEVDYKQLHEWHAGLVRTYRQDIFGHVDPEGSEADIKLLDDKFKEGDIYEAGDLIHRYDNSDEFNSIWVKRSEAQSTMDQELDQAQTICNNRVTAREQEIIDLKKDVEEMEGLLHMKDSMQQTQKQFSLIEWIKNLFRKG